ncbi:hypothetical protein ACK8HX_08675 [Oryzobacter sp. R7]|uniref:hypothetical protein n=1 Tax=Oryzobacter faecalis TaxID=3388656 RepID=UPI00398C8A4F
MSNIPPSPGHEPDAGAPSEDTTVLPQQAADAPDPASEQVAATTEAARQDPPTAPLPPQPAAAAAAAAAAAGGPPRGPRGWWGQATSTGGGRAALVTAGVLGAVVVLVGAALLGAVVGRVADWGRHDRVALTQERSDRGWMDVPGQQRRLGQGEKGPGRGQDEVGPGIPGSRNGDGTGMRGGMGPGRGAAGLGGGVLHGEFTTTANGEPTVMVVQTGEVRTYTSGRSLTLRSSDGFEATYSLDDSVVTPRVAARLVTGAQVRVVAVKEGMKVTRLAVVS